MKEMLFRPASLKEREYFYENEFDIKKVKRWFIDNGIEIPQICAIDAGSDTKIVAEKKYLGYLLYFPFGELLKKIKMYIPEDVYYDRNKYENYKSNLKKLDFRRFIAQELVFDIDADNIKCNCEDVCEVCLTKSYAATKRLNRELKRYFKKITVVYSGRGFHIHVLDKEAFFMDFEEREKITTKLSKYPIDPWVSTGHINLIRMPYSLNGLVSRIVIPVKDKNFMGKDACPKFLN